MENPCECGIESPISKSRGVSHMLTITREVGETSLPLTQSDSMNAKADQFPG